MYNIFGNIFSEYFGMKNGVYSSIIIYIMNIIFIIRMSCSNFLKYILTIMNLKSIFENCNTELC